MSVLGLREIADTLKNGGVLVIVVGAEGSTPARPGAKMAVLPDGESFGTIGGGALETTAIDEARKRFISGKAGIVEYEMGVDGLLGAECGGSAILFFDPIRPKNRLWLFGSGHVGREIAKVAAVAGWHVVAIDDRAGAASAENISANEHIEGDYDHLSVNLPIGAMDYVVIVTAGHEGDETILKNLLRREEWPIYVGLMGSEIKKAAIFKRAKDEHLSKEKLLTVHAPIGLNIGTVEPGEIAVAVVAEMLCVRNKIEDVKKCSE